MHGTTVATNALIERKGAKVAFVTTAGFEDIPYIQRVNRQELYNLDWDKPRPLLQSRRHCFGLHERINGKGEVVKPLDMTEVDALCDQLIAGKFEAVAVCLLFAYASTQHEQLIKQRLSERLNSVPLSISHEIAPIWREYERSSTTIAERRMREEIQRIPDGVYHYEDVIEDDGVGKGSYPIRCTVYVEGDKLTADFTGSAKQCPGPMNATYAVTGSAVYNALLHLTDPTIPRNEGCYRPINIVAPPGTIVNCRYPAALVGGNTEVSPRITDIIFGALSTAIPDRVPAAQGGSSCCFLFGGAHPETGQLYSHFHFEGVGWGGRPHKDGNSQVIVINGNCRNTPVEIFENRYPLSIDSYRLLEDSGGPGKNRGGLGIERIFTIQCPEVTVSAIFNRMLVQPFGLHGGQPGHSSGIYVRRAGETEWRTFKETFGTVSPSKFSDIVLEQGDQVKIIAPGGGWGDPHEREPERVLQDVAEGFVTPAAAAREYGVSIVEQTPGNFVIQSEMGRG